ncbi:GntR family transcriptional regulator [Microbacterium alcoholitolerans]|uniref:GntR family transcriptional regulator n=1 Tax=unclassified Microbacterium TaxID=2609290 RepID=UPI003D16CC32
MSRATASTAVAGTPPLGRTTLPAQIHGFLEEAIIHGEIAPSTRLNADEIAAQYGVSRIPVREALRSLHEAGWVDIRPRHGVYVRERSMTELHELFETRSGIEAHIAALAAERRTDDELALLRSAVEAGQSAAQTGDSDAVAEASVQFNQTVREACNNSVMATLSAALEKRARFYFAMVEGRLGADWVSVERQLMELIAKQDAEGAAEAARTHIIDTGTAVASLLDNQD